MSRARVYFDRNGKPVRELTADGLNRKARKVIAVRLGGDGLVHCESYNRNGADCPTCKYRWYCERDKGYYHDNTLDTMYRASDLVYTTDINEKVLFYLGLSSCYSSSFCCPHCSYEYMIYARAIIEGDPSIEHRIYQCRYCGYHYTMNVPRTIIAEDNFGNWYQVSPDMVIGRRNYHEDN